MRRPLLCAGWMLGVCVAALSAIHATTSTAQAAGFVRPQPRYDLFYNYYAGPSVYGGQPAQLYVSPRPTPTFIGETYITYQPLMPHEFLYHHSRSYHRWNFYDCGATKTKVCWW